MPEYFCWLDRCDMDERRLDVSCCFRVVAASCEDVAIDIYLKQVLPGDEEFNQYVADHTNLGFASNFGELETFEDYRSGALVASVSAWFGDHQDYAAAYLRFLDEKLSGRPLDHSFPPGFFEFVANKVGRDYVDVGCMALGKLRCPE